MTSTTENRTTELDSCKVVRLDGVEVQENGIIRDARGWIIGRADTEWMRYQWRMTVSGVCPCCGREVDGDDEDGVKSSDSIEHSEKEALIDALTAIASAISFCETDMQIVVQDRLNLVYDAIERLNGTRQARLSESSVERSNDK